MSPKEIEKMTFDKALQDSILQGYDLGNPRLLRFADYLHRIFSQ